MEIFNFIILALLGIAFAALGLYFLIIITKNVKQGHVVRQQLANRVETLRMSKMLRALGLDFSKYLHTVPLVKVDDSMSKCETCSTTDQCDQQLKEDQIELKDIHFCPNQQCLTHFKNQKEEE